MKLGIQNCGGDTDSRTEDGDDDDDLGPGGELLVGPR